MRTPPPMPDDWNLLITTRNGRRRDVRLALRPLIHLSACGLRNLLVGHVDDFDALLTAIGDLCERQPFLQHWMGRVRPIERHFPIDLTRFPEQLEEQVRPFLDRIAGHSFYVRVDRRGHKGRLDSHELELGLGEFVYTELKARGLSPTVTFADPDIVLTVDILRDVAGLGAISRALRQRSPFIKIS